MPGIQISVAACAVVVWVQKVYSDVGKGNYLPDKCSSTGLVPVPRCPALLEY